MGENRREVVGKHFNSSTCSSKSIIAYSIPTHQSNTENRKNSAQKFIICKFVPDNVSLVCYPTLPHYIFLCQRKKNKEKKKEVKHY